MPTLADGPLSALAAIHAPHLQTEAAHLLSQVICQAAQRFAVFFTHPNLTGGGMRQVGNALHR